MGKQRCDNTGPLTRERMKTVDAEFLKATEDFIDRCVKDDKPFFVWFNPTRMHIWTHVPQEYIQKAVDEGRPEIDLYRAGMIQHDEQVGQLLKKLDDLGVADNTIVVYSTDNGYELIFWPDGGVRVLSTSYAYLQCNLADKLQLSSKTETEIHRPDSFEIACGYHC